jgi:hypothetical protein
MKNRQAILFYILAVISTCLIPIIRKYLENLVSHDLVFINLYDNYLIATTVLSILTGIVYSIMQQIGKPVNATIGNFHFILILTGLIFSMNIYTFIMGFFIFGFLPDTTSYASDITSIIIILFGPFLMTSGLIVFIIGVTKAIRKKTNAY